jgi:hypothetical protein
MVAGLGIGQATTGSLLTKGHMTSINTRFPLAQLPIARMLEEEGDGEGDHDPPAQLPAGAQLSPRTPCGRCLASSAPASATDSAATAPSSSTNSTRPPATGGGSSLI